MQLDLQEMGRAEVTMYAANDLQQQIREMNFPIDPQEAAQVGANYVAYFEEYRSMLARAFGTNRGASEIGTMQSSLVEARRGNFDGLKLFLDEYSVELTESCDYPQCDDCLFGQNLRLLVACIPPEGEPIQLPRPATLPE